MPVFDVSGVSVDFPFEPYDCQVAYMKKVIDCLQHEQNGILESPTGTGKTLCLLCASMAWLQGRKAQVDLNKQMGAAALFGDKENLQDDLMKKVASKLKQSSGSSWGPTEYVVPKIIYASRTHSQISQVIQELKRTSYNTMNSCVLGSREQMCIDEKVSKETNNTTKIHMCRAKVQARRCHYYNVLDGRKCILVPQGRLIFNRFETSTDMKKNSEVRQVLGTVVDIEDLVSKGKMNKLCPYYMARELKGDADIIFMPYNYLLDPKSRRAHGVELQGNIVIFDEAHNLEKICEESASFDLSSVDIATAMEETTRLMEKVIEMDAVENTQVTEFGDSAAVVPDFTLEDLLKLKEILQQLEGKIDEIHIPGGGQGLTKSGMFMFELLAQVCITFETKPYVLDVLEKVVAYLTSDGSGSSLHSKGAGLSKFCDVLKIVFSQEVSGEMSLTQHQARLTQSYKVHIHLKDRGKKKKADPWSSGGSEKPERVISYWCFSPGHSMRDLSDHGVKSIILTSGTLSPIDSFTMEMQIPFPVVLENPHVIEKEQVYISVVGRGPDSTVLNSNYETRFTPSYQSSLGNAVFNFARVVPNGLLIFFPSYPVMEKCVEFWQDNNIWSRVTQYKPIFVESKGKLAFTDTMEEYYEKINDPTLNGAIFMAVCRGKVSEGLDFSDNNGRAVMITGLPFPPRMDPRVVLKMQYLDEMRRKSNGKMLSGQAWYRQQASRAVNQAIGRVIRHKQDFGAILLCDTRFGSPDSLAQLPVWVRPYVQKPANFGHSIRDMLSFFKTVQKMMPAPQVKKKTVTVAAPGCQGAYFQPTISARTGAKMNIQYEQARTVPCHVPSLRPNTESTLQSFSGLSSQYKGAARSTQSQSSRQSLLQALDHNESHTDDADNAVDSQIPSYQPVRPNQAKKRKIVVKRGGDTALSSTTVHASSSASVRQLNKAEDYISQVKKVLTPESYKQFSRALLEYRKEEDLTKVTTVLADLFTATTDHYPLFRMFYKYARPQHKQEFHQLCLSITGQGCGYRPEDSLSSKRLLHDKHDERKNDKRPKLESSSSSGSSKPGTSFQSQKLTSASDTSVGNSVSELSTSSIPSSVTLNGLSQIMHCKSTTKTCDKSSTNCDSNMNGVRVTDTSDSRSDITSRTSDMLSQTCSGSPAMSVSSCGSSVASVGPAPRVKQESQTTSQTSSHSQESPLACSGQSISKIRPSQVQTGYTCGTCQKDAHIPFRSQCGHVCCYLCWKQIFQTTKMCPECGERVRRRHLTQLLFASGPNI